LMSAREDPQEWTAKIHRRAKGLALPDHDVRAEIAGRSHDRLGDGIHAHDEDALRGGPDLLELLLEATEEVRVLRVDAAYVRGDGFAQLRQIEHPRLAVVLHLTNRAARSDEVVGQDRTAIVPQRPWNEERLAAMEAVGHPRGLTEGGRSIVHRGVRSVHPREFADQALVFPQGLKESLAQFRLVRSIRGIELRARRERPHARRDKMVVRAAPEEGWHVDDGAVRREHRGDAPDDDVLGQTVRKVELRDTDRGRDVREEVLDAP